MTIFGINRICNWVQIFSDSCRKYTCPTKEINGKLFFLFKKEWHPVEKYITEYTTELFEEGGRTFSRHILKK
ncbi:MAG: hypothetical protein IJM27_01295 [Eubacterium sp.]|nr:hypothetical protein [Eubacterium sp.]